jgi:hypothetical protein
MLWERHAAQWHRVRGPLRPTAEDVAIIQREVDRLARDTSTLRALLLGVTVELANLIWPVEAALLAVDLSDGMLREHWHPPPGVRSQAVRGRWQSLPVSPEGFHLVMADGSFCALPDTQAIRATARQVAMALADNGRLVMRAFTRPERREPPECVLDDLRRNRIASIHVAKWRLAMSLHGPLACGIPLDAVWRVFRDAEPDSHSLSQRTGWPVAEIDTIDAYRGVSTPYLFPTLEELRELMSENLIERSCHFPTYELGQCCPTLIFEVK